MTPRRPVAESPPEEKVRYLLIVAHDAPELCDYLRQNFAGDSKVQVLLDRRRGERRKRTEPHEPERRWAERRRQPGGHPRSDWFVVARRQTD